MSANLIAWGIAGVVVVAWLWKKGYTNLFNLKGGMGSWNGPVK